VWEGAGGDPGPYPIIGGGMDNTINYFLKHVGFVLKKMEQVRVFNYQKPLLAHANSALTFFEEECSESISEYLETFFKKAGERVKDLFEEEIASFAEAVNIMEGYALHKKWWDKSMGMVLTIIGSIKNLVSDFLDADPLVKAGIEILEEAIKFLKE
jgi:hypothetical protein